MGFAEKYEDARQLFQGKNYQAAKQACEECLNLPDISPEDQEQAERLLFLVNEKLAASQVMQTQFGDEYPADPFGEDFDEGGFSAASGSESFDAFTPQPPDPFQFEDTGAFDAGFADATTLGDPPPDDVFAQTTMSEAELPGDMADTANGFGFGAEPDSGPQPGFDDSPSPAGFAGFGEGEAEAELQAFQSPDSKPDHSGTSAFNPDRTELDPFSVVEQAEGGDIDEFIDEEEFTPLIISEREGKAPPEPDPVPEAEPAASEQEVAAASDDDDVYAQTAVDKPFQQEAAEEKPYKMVPDHDVPEHKGREPEPAPLLMITPPAYLNLATQGKPVRRQQIPIQQNEDYDIFAPAYGDRGLHLMEVGASFVLALHPFKLLYAAGGLGIVLLLLNLAYGLVTAGPTDTQGMGNILTLFMGVVAWVVFWSIPPGIAHMTRAQLERRPIPDPFRTFGYVMANFSVSIIWPLAIVGVAGLIGLIARAFGWMNTTASAPEAAATSFVAYVLVFLGVLLLVALTVGFYLPAAIVGLGRARNLGGLTDTFFRVFLYRLPRLVLYTVWLAIITGICWAAFAGINYLAFLALNAAYATEGGETWSTAVRAILMQAEVYMPFIGGVYDLIGADPLPLTVANAGHVTGAVQALSITFTAIVTIILAFGFSIFFTGGTLVYVLLRRFRRD